MRKHKLTLIFIFGIALPLATMFLVGFMANYRMFRWGYDNKNGVTTLALWISLITSAVVFYLNSKSRPPSSYWRIASLVLVILLGLLIYITGSLSHFGF